MQAGAALAFALIALAGLCCQWLAWFLRVPSILFLLLAGIVAGPAFGWLDPDALLGELLFPLVSLAVAIILFEGSLTLRFDEIRGLDGMVRRLVSLGALLNWLIISFAANQLLDFGADLALLFGALVVVTGPTVISPLLRSVRPHRRIGSVLRWEGIVIDPLGALLAVVVYEYVVASSPTGAVFNSVLAFVRVLGVGAGIGLAFGFTLASLLRGQYLPGYLHNLASVTLVLTAFSLANVLAHEAGLLTVTVMGIFVANMRDVNSEEILSFKEHLSLFFISGVFILLAARLDPAALFALGWNGVLLLGVIQLIARPVAVGLSALGTDLNWREIALVSWIGPRGIVAAAVSALFALRLEQRGYDSSSLLVAASFAVIIGTVLLQSLTARPLANLLKVAEPSRRGFLIVGANAVARALAEALAKQDLRVLLCDTNRDNVRTARMEGLETFYGNVLSEYADTHIDLTGIGKLLASHPQREHNVLCALRFRPEFGAQNIYALRTSLESRVTSKQSIASQLKGQMLGGEALDYGRFAGLLQRGATIRTTRLTENFGYDDWLAQRDGRIIPLFTVDKRNRIRAFAEDQSSEPEAGWSIIGLDHSEVKEPGDQSTSETRARKSP